MLPLHSIELAVRVKQLELTLAHALDAIHVLATRLEAALGPTVAGSELERLSDAGTAAREYATTMTSLIQQGQEGKAARIYRDIAGVTWDEAHAVVAYWNSCSLDENARRLQLVLWVKACRAVMDQA